VLDHTPTIRLSRLTTHVVPIAPRVRSGVPFRCAHNFAVSRFCARSRRPNRRLAHSGHHDGLIPCRCEPQSGLTWPETRPSLGLGLPIYRGRRQSPQPEPQPAERPPRHACWVTIYETLHRLSAQGTPIATMARHLGISRPTVYADLRRDTPPGPRRLQRPSSARVLTPYLPYLIRRWRERGADSRQLWREIQARGYAHAARTVGRFITQLRRAADAGLPPESQGSPYTRP
jgi:hypothetical protein